jgi:two-component system, LytTR family, sensor kinase
MRGVRAWLAIWAGWTSLAVFYAVSTSLTYRSSGRPANWALTFKRSLSEWWLWAALTPLIMWLAARFPVSGARRWRNVALHVVFGLLIAVGKTFADRTTFFLLTGFRSYILLSTVALHFTLYLAIVAAAHGVEYYRRSREREHLEARLAETRLQLLSMQLQPHFLFNTLNTIAELVHDDPEAADRMIAGLSDLLRRTLDLGEAQEVSLDEELDVLMLYLDIQKVRFGDRLQVSIDVPPHLREARVPALLLQPLVENSIRHSVAARAGAGRIAIRAESADGTLRVEVADDGEVREDEPAPSRKGIGLNNVRARLETLYGAAASLELTRAAGQGTRVSVRLPLRRTGAAT